jgi:DNA helicase II / ATP-dependent DNA helicase PcrA
MMNWPDQHNSNEKPPFLTNLNPSQEEAVLHTEGPVMIIAGAGSGKTRVLTFRIANIMHKGTDAFNILALTFTNKAAREMRNRIESIVGTEARNIWMGTFHSVFAKILRQEADKLNYPSSFTIYDSEDSKNLIKSIIKELNLDDKVYKPSLVLSRISLSKNNLLTANGYAKSEELVNADKASGRPLFGQIFAQYTERCFKAGAMDFDDILVNTYRLLEKFPDVLNKWQHKFKYILVDEYQDTNHVQYMITKRLAAVNQNICVVGDDAQSIYAFRGANIENILNYERDYPNVAIFKLEQNYRSTRNIVFAASSLIANNKKQLKKEIWTANEDGDKIKIVRNPSDNDEGRKVAELIFEDKHKLHLPNKAFAILYRTNAQSRALEESLRRQNIEYKIYGGISFYQRKEIKDLLSYLRLVVNPNDEEALKRVINYPVRGIGNTTLTRLIYIANQNQIPLWEVVRNIRQFPDIGTGGPKVEHFGMLIESFRGQLDFKNAYDVATDVAKQTGLLKALYEDKSVEGISRYENITELLNSIQEFTEDDEDEVDKTLPNFLEKVALYTDDEKDNDPNRDHVSLMTIHASKGLEFPIVHIVGMEENLFPSQMALMNRMELEEERRLFYVAITRAERKLYLSFATSRFKHGSLLHCEPSRFLQEIDNQYLDMSMASMQQRSMFEQDGYQRSHGGYSANRGSGFGGNSYGGQNGTGSRNYNGNGQNGSNNRNQSGNGSQYVRKDQPTTQKVIFTTAKSSPALPPEDPNFEAGDISGIQVGQQVQHQRFGIGTVMDIEGQADSRKAKISFDAVGVKTLVLKFAKMRILGL